MLNLWQKHDGIFSQIARRLVIAVLAFTVLNITFVLATYINNVPDLGHSLMSRQAAEIGTAIKYFEGVGFTYDNEKFRREYIGDAKLAFAAYDKEGHEIIKTGSIQLTNTLMPPITSVAEETRRDDYKDKFILRGIRRLEIDNKSVWISMVVEGKGLRPFLPVIVLEVIDHVGLPLIPLSILLLFFNVIAVRSTLTPLTNAIAQINAINPREIEQRLEVPASPLEVRHLVTAMNDALARLESAIRSLRNFTADTAHELRTPLAIMTIEVENLPESNGKIKLKNDVEGMTRLVTQMLDMAYADGLIIHQSARCDLAEIVSDVISQLTPLALNEQKGIIFNAGNNHIINGHAEALGRALRNIIENALAHTPVNTDVEVSIGETPQITVRDHGAGIPEDKQQESLNRFWRGERKKTNGAGLGLAIAARIIKAHGGIIRISSANDGGAVVSLNLERTI